PSFAGLLDSHICTEPVFFPSPQRGRGWRRRRRVRGVYAAGEAGIDPPHPPASRAPSPAGGEGKKTASAKICEHDSSFAGGGVGEGGWLPLELLQPAPLGHEQRDGLGHAQGGG